MTGNLLKCKNQTLLELVVESDLFTYVLDMFFKYEWNNLLHLQIEKILKNTLESENPKIIDALFTKSKYVERIMEAFDTREVSPGYINFISYLQSL